MEKSTRNKTITIEDHERARVTRKLIENMRGAQRVQDITNKIIVGDVCDVAQHMPRNFVDLLILDPPYNLHKNFGTVRSKKLSIHDYSQYIDTFLKAIMHTLTRTASIYICGDWYSSMSLCAIAHKYFVIQNRITWQREKGRGAAHNWKNAHEDIWFCTMSKDYVFNVDTVKTRKKVVAPYTQDGLPKDWQKTEEGNFRDTYPSNFWDDITIPYWSMAENTAHPTQKPEKLIAKLVLASSNEGDFVCDPFVGSGTSCVVAKKLGRRYVGIDTDKHYACVSQKRLDAVQDSTIQGYSDGVFWARNTHSHQKKHSSETGQTKKK